MDTMTKTRPICDIAWEITADWRKPNYAAVPYLDAMREIRSINGRYGEDTAASVVRYFLANANSWRGDVAKRVKAELKDMLKGA